MIQKELFMTRDDGVKLYRTYSDCDCDLLQVETGVIYSEAVDVEGTEFTYEEVERKEEGDSENEPLS